ncbi:MAG: acylphosphatase [Chloroflexota bacterium]|nr:acylphosphatase [Chloroflexota bacterium]
MIEQNDLRLHAYLTGNVQGVGFRYFVLQHAQALDLTGWVRNLWDGRVEVTAEGPHDAVNQLLVHLRRGPISADVKDIDFDFSDSKGEFMRFGILQTL